MRRATCRASGRGLTRHLTPGVERALVGSPGGLPSRARAPWTRWTPNAPVAVAGRAPPVDAIFPTRVSAPSCCTARPRHPLTARGAGSVREHGRATGLPPRGGTAWRRRDRDSCVPRSRAVRWHAPLGRAPARAPVPDVSRPAWQPLPRPSGGLLDRAGGCRPARDSRTGPGSRRRSEHYPADLAAVDRPAPPATPRPSSCWGYRCAGHRQDPRRRSAGHREEGDHPGRGGHRP